MDFGGGEHNKSDYTGQHVTWAMFDGVRKAWIEAGLIEHKPGYPGMLALGNPGPTSGKLTRYRATPRLLEIAAGHGITPANVLEHFRFEFEMAYVLISAPRRIALATTRFADATCGTIRLKLFKIGAHVRISVRRIKFSMASAFPYTDAFRTAWAALNRATL